MKISSVITSIIMLMLLSILSLECVKEIKMISPSVQALPMQFIFEKNEFVTYSIKVNYREVESSGKEG